MADEVRAVLDSNVVVDGFLNRRRASSEVMRALFSGIFRAYVTSDVLAEYELALRSQSVRNAALTVGLHANFVHLYAQAVADSVELVAPGPSFRTSDPDDDKFTACSTGAHATHLISSDHSLLDMGTVLEAVVMTPEAFAKVIDA